jgi:hypothetical protein
MARRSNLVYALSELLTQPTALEPRLLRQVDMEMRKKGYTIQNGRIVRLYKDGSTYSTQGGGRGKTQVLIKKNGASFSFPDSTA